MGALDMSRGGASNGVVDSHNQDAHASSSSKQSSANTSVTTSPQPSRDSSPIRPPQRSSSALSRASLSSGPRSRKNSYQDQSPSRLSRSTVPSPAAIQRSLSSNTTPALVPSSQEPVNTKQPQKSPLPVEQVKDTPRWPIPPRLRSPPPVIGRQNLGPPSRQETPSINVQRATPSPQLEPQSQSQGLVSDSDTDDVSLHSGMRTPARGGAPSASMLETVQEVSLPNSPRHGAAALEQVTESLLSEAAARGDPVELSANKGKNRPSLAATPNESGSENGGTSSRRSMSVAPPPLLSRQSSSNTVKLNGGKGKSSEGSIQQMTVETETVTSVPQVSLAPGNSVQGSQTSLRTKPSSETIRPKKEKKEKKKTRKQTTVPQGAGEHDPEFHNVNVQHCASGSTLLRHPSGHPSGQDMLSSDPNSPSQSMFFAFKNSLGLPATISNALTRLRTASSKADIFEAKIASAIDETNTSDSEETFVYDSNPPDTERRHGRFHSRTPSATSMMSQADRPGMRSIHAVMENPGPSHGMTVKKGMKFVNTSNSNMTDGVPGDDDGRGTGRSIAGATRGTSRHHHVNNWRRNNGNSHASLFDSDGPFPNVVRQKLNTGSASRNSSAGPPSPRQSHTRGVRAKRSMQMANDIDLDDSARAADDERTPLLNTSSIRSSASRRNNPKRPPIRHLEAQTYHQNPSILTRFASCLVLTIMILLVVTGAIGFMFATSQPLTDIKLTKIDNVVASEQELMLDVTVKAHNPNVVVVAIESADIEVFAKSPHAGTDSEWWRYPHGPPEAGSLTARRGQGADFEVIDDRLEDSPKDDNAPNMRLGAILEFDSPLSFEGSFFHGGISVSTGSVRLQKPGNNTAGGTERWERILDDDFDLILKGVLKYSLPLSQRIRSVAVTGRTTVKSNAATDPSLRPNGTDFSANV
ncbi:hypothetical protein MKZ38_001048 [Zalerion maritima]|uniref:Uncharacterized protein n=1 Tax=Zalerion maritima TaxID=339359 RepID=A0AAD5RRW9_9PEZI|nr:hypothetical protein MKZ38_001048 [Zalerion maritima]